MWQIIDKLKNRWEGICYPFYVMAGDSIKLSNGVIFVFEEDRRFKTERDLIDYLETKGVKCGKQSQQWKEM